MTLLPGFGVRIVSGLVLLIAVGAAGFVGGLLTGHRSEQTLMSSADASFALGVLRRLEANDVPGAKQELFSILEQKVLMHWNASQVGIADFAAGAAPMDVVLIQRAMKGREGLLADPDIQAYRRTQEKDNKYYAAVESRLQEVEKRYAQ